MNVQVVTDPDGRLLWLSPGRLGDRPDLADRTHRIIRICERQGVPLLADLGYQGVGTYAWAGSQMRNEVDLAKVIERPEAGDCTTYLIVGSDSREGMSAEEKGFKDKKSGANFQAGEQTQNDEPVTVTSNR